MKFIILAITISILHFMIGLWLSSKSFGHAFSVFDTGKKLSVLEKINNVVVEVLFFPIVTIFENTTYEGSNLIAQYFPFMLNSALWGILIVYGYNIILHRNN